MLYWNKFFNLRLPLVLNGLPLKIRRGIMANVNKKKYNFEGPFKVPKSHDILFLVIVGTGMCSRALFGSACKVFWHQGTQP